MLVNATIVVWMEPSFDSQYHLSIFKKNEDYFSKNFPLTGLKDTGR